MYRIPTLHNDNIAAKLAFALLSLCFVVSTPGEEIYFWPLDLPRELSSSFAEYRAGRFHAGIDLRTGGVIGKPVYAAADGYVSRVRCSPWGYGKAVYVQFRDGNSAVYAHLDDYFDGLREYVRRNQHAKRSYTVDLYPESGLFPVRRGQQIAVSGSTGVGPPHLHYELRDASNRPFNPRLAGIQWPDTTRPIIRGLLVAPDGPDGTVNGGYSPQALEVVHHGSGRYTTSPITASGRIGVGVDVIDPGNDGIRLGVHILRMLHEDRELFRVQHDYLSYDNIHNGVVAYHPFFLDKGRFLLLWRWPGNVSHLYSHSPGNGWFDMPDAPTELVVEAVDFMGNTATLTIPLSPHASRPTPHASAVTDNAPGSVALECFGEHLVLTTTFPTAEERAPELFVESGATLQLFPFHNVSDRAWAAAFKPEQSGEHVLRVVHPRIPFHEETAHVLRRGSPARSIVPGGGDYDPPSRHDDARLSVKSNSPYGVMFAQISPVANTSAASIRQLGKAWRIWPENTPVDAPVELSLPIPDNVENPVRAAIYRDTGSGWRHVGGKPQGDRLTASVRSFGVYAVLEDTLPPSIRDVSPPDQHRAQTQRPILRAVITDVGSGIAAFEITANGKWLLAEYAPDENRLAWKRDHDLPAGEQELIFRVTDNAGNIATVRRVVHIP